jgi:hypothetical protein
LISNQAEPNSEGLFSHRREVPDASATGGDEVVDVRPSARLVMIRGMRLELDGVEALGDEWRERCSTTIQAAGAYVIVVETVLLSRNVALSSCYLAGLSGSTAVSHLLKAPGMASAFSQRLLAVMPGETHARACLLDHAAELRAMLDPDGEEAISVEVSDAALARAAAVWREPEG